ncbi:MAG: aldehyde dehydrogenase family protein, partial [Cyclobacteriaceae bacterium]|nr:aldehyde dehydrogenase family protein [Cyclobacteriaceae bacterium]
MSIHGLNHIGSERKGSGSNKFKAFSPEKGEMLPEEFISATHEEIEETLQLAEQAFQLYNKKSSIEKAVFLETIAQEIENLGDELIFRAMAESGLPEGRIRGERGRTTGQLHLFARVLRDGQWLEASIDTAIPDRAPLPKPDIRSMRRGVGPVVVFTASNFPLAFSTAGGDTASALAAGNPVIVKCHEGHPGTNALVSDAIQNAAKKCNMPNGVFSSLQGTGFELGKTLVMHPATKSVAFTGSHNGGMALWKMAAEREEPIPVFAEMGSINPSFILPRYLDNNTQTLAKNMAGSILLGVGQFCTNPGLIVIQNSDNSDEFIETLAQEIEASAPASMLNENVFNQYNQKVGAISTHKG